MISNSGHIELPNSKCSVDNDFLARVYLTAGWLQIILKNCVDSSPDIWVPAKEAETLAAKLMENLK